MNMADYLTALNKWWRKYDIEPILLHKRIRSEFSTIIKNMTNESILALTGPCGCGKTTLFYQTVDYLIKMGIQPEKILYLEGDDPYLLSENLQDILKTYFDKVLMENPDELTSPVYILMDNTHLINNWETPLRRHYLKRTKLKFLLSAPVKSLLFPAGDELLSHCIEIPLSPLTPSQFIEFHSIYSRNRFDNITFKSLMPPFILFDNPVGYTRSLISNIRMLSVFRDDKISLLNEYFLAGGYPGYFGYEDMSQWHRALRRDMLNLGLYRDIFSNFNIKSPTKVKQLLFVLAQTEGLEQSYAALGKQLSLNTVTIISHLSFLLEDSLIAVCENYSGKKGGVTRKNKRFFLRDIGLKHALLWLSEPGAFSLESAVLNITASLAGNFADKNASRVLFWKNSQCEVDIVIDKGFTLLPVSIVLKNEVTHRDIKGITSFCKGQSARNAVVITNDTLQIINGICFVPYWLL